MSISQELFYAIVSLDSYNRGYGAGLSDGGAGDPDGLGEAGFIGDVRILARPDGVDNAAWMGGAGFETTQTEMAAQFQYQVSREGVSGGRGL